MTTSTIIAPHHVDAASEHYASVAAYMAEHGAPEIRAWWSDDCGAWVAVEGSHRLAIAHATGVTPVIVDVGESDADRAEALRTSDIDEGALYGRRDDDDSDIVAWWESYRRTVDAPSYDFE